MLLFRRSPTSESINDLISRHRLRLSRRHKIGESLGQHSSNTGPLLINDRVGALVRGLLDPAAAGGDDPVVPTRLAPYRPPVFEIEKPSATLFCNFSAGQERNTPVNLPAGKSQSLTPD